jgi:hypothetical protein
MISTQQLFWLVVIIAILTVATGLTQIATPGLVLNMMSAESTPTSRYFFSLVGMFMALFGGALLHAMFATVEQPVVVFWAGLQKIGAVLGVGIGVLHAIFSPIALLVAAFDLLSCIIILIYWRKMRTEA